MSSSTILGSEPCISRAFLRSDGFSPVFSLPSIQYLSSPSSTLLRVFNDLILMTTAAMAMSSTRAAPMYKKGISSPFSSGWTVVVVGRGVVVEVVELVVGEVVGMDVVRRVVAGRVVVGIVVGMVVGIVVGTVVSKVVGTVVGIVVPGIAARVLVVPGSQSRSSQS